MPAWTKESESQPALKVQIIGIGHLIRKLRRDRGIQASHVAKACGFLKARYSKTEHNGLYLDLETLRTILTVLRPTEEERDAIVGEVVRLLRGVEGKQEKDIEQAVRSDHCPTEVHAASPGGPAS